jgi:hypothetical protein
MVLMTDWFLSAKKNMSAELFKPNVTFLTSALKQDMHSKEELDTICQMVSEEAKLGDTQPFKLLKAIATLESSYGLHCVPRYEPAYGTCGLYYAANAALKMGNAAYGALSACSFGPFQIMWVVALENGYPFVSSPLDLWSGLISGPYVVSQIEKLYNKGAKTTGELLRCYNGGLGSLKKPNQNCLNYQEKGLKLYQSF